MGQEVLEPAAADVQDNNNNAGDGNVAKLEQNLNADITFSDVFGMQGNAMTHSDANEKQGMIWKKPPEVTDEDRKDAKEDLADEVSDLIPEEDRKNLIKAQEAIIDGDPKKLAEALQAYANDPEKLAKIVKELDKNLTSDGAGVHLAMNKAGNVILYGHGKTALEISPKDGSVGVRDVEHNKDGSIVLLDGEVVGADAGKVARGIGDDATRGINGPVIYFKPKPGEPWNPGEPWHGPGGGGGHGHGNGINRPNDGVHWKPMGQNSSPNEGEVLQPMNAPR